MKTLLQELLQNRLDSYLFNTKVNHRFYLEDVERKQTAVQNRHAELVKVTGKGKITSTFRDEDEVDKVKYQLVLRYIIRQKGQIFMEESAEERQAEIFRSTIVDDYPLFLEANLLKEWEKGQDFQQPMSKVPSNMDFYPSKEEEDEPRSYHYDRRKAVQYAERWWNTYNPKYKKFENDCTSFISQCLHEGGAPMRGYPNRGKGWWMQSNSWSYSWAVAHSLRLYLANSKTGLRTREVSSPEELLLGDVICYDFEGDGRYNHNTIVTSKDAYGMPLVNAHTYNSRARYWAYEDSTAYTPNIKYKFFSIVDG